MPPYLVPWRTLYLSIYVYTWVEAPRDAPLPRTLYLSIYVYTWVEAPRDAPLPRPLAYPVCVCV